MAGPVLNPVLLIVLFLKSVLPGQTFFINERPAENSTGRLIVQISDQQAEV
jgi:hypothetical protein